MRAGVITNINDPVDVFLCQRNCHFYMRHTSNHIHAFSLARFKEQLPHSYAIVFTDEHGFLCKNYSKSAPKH